MPKIDFTRDEVKRQLGKWTKVRDCIAGEETIKSKGTAYLPKPNPEDKSTANRLRYAAYVLRAMFLNATANTLEGLVGQVFSADPVVDLPTEMEIIDEDADGSGVTLTQRAKKVLSEVLAFGRGALMVDFPEPFRDEEGVPRDFTRQEMQDGIARPNILQFSPWDVINWRTRVIGGQTVLSLVVIAMKYIVYDDGFEIKEDDEWRVLKLDAENKYVCEVWRKNTNMPTAGQAPEPFILTSRYFPTNSRGERLTFIPFTFVGSLNNNQSPDKPPMYDIACVNIAHYRNSADYEDNVYMLGQGTPVATGLTASWVKDVWKDQPMQLGSRGVVPLPQGGDFKIVASAANGMVKEAMDSKERQMAMLGAQLVEKQEVQRTLGEAKLERAVIESVLVQCAKNTGAAIQKCLRWAADFYGADPEKVFYELSTDFAISKLTPEDRRAILLEWQGGLTTFEEARNQLRQGGIAYLDDKVAKQQIDDEMAARVDLDGDPGAGGEGGEE